MKYCPKPSPNRSYKKLTPSDQYNVDDAIESLKNFFAAGARKEGLGLKRLRWDFWEIRASLKLRLLFTFKHDVISFVIVGNHDDVRKHLRSL